MTQDTLKLTALTATILTVPALAFAGLTVGDTMDTSAEAIRTALEAQGATILEIETEDGEIEVEYMLDGLEYEAEIDATSGEILEVELEDDEDEDQEDEDEKEG